MSDTPLWLFADQLGPAVYGGEHAHREVLLVEATSALSKRRYHRQKLHLVLSAIVARDDRDRLGALLRFAPTSLLGAGLILVAAFLDGDVRIALWLLALAVDYLGPVVIGVGAG